jgi:hypothetical protein
MKGLLQPHKHSLYRPRYHIHISELVVLQISVLFHLNTPKQASSIIDFFNDGILHGAGLEISKEFIWVIKKSIR